MKRGLIILLLLCLGNIVLAQKEKLREISGIVLSSQGIPYRGLQFYVNTGGKYTTDNKGEFKVQVKPNSTFSFYSKIIKVEAKDSLVVIISSNREVHAEWYNKIDPLNNIWSLPFYFDESVQGIATLEDNSASWEGNAYEPLFVTDIIEKNNRIILTDYQPKTKRLATGYELNYSNTIGLNFHTQLPDLQNTYAQGGGSDENSPWYRRERFSWGPDVRTLEYDGSAYPYDVNGRLVPAGTGNGIPANTYGIRDFFRAGFFTKNNVNLLLPTFLKGYLETNLGQNLTNSPIRNSNFQSYNLSAALKRMTIGDLKAESKVAFYTSKGNLLPRGGNIADLLFNLYSTPSTFDNNNTLSARQAANSEEAWRLSSGDQRSYSDFTINPYALLNASNNIEESSHFLVSGNMKYREDANEGFKASLMADYNIYTDTRNRTDNTMKNYSMLLNREHNLYTKRIELNPSYTFNRNFQLVTSFVHDYFHGDVDFRDKTSSISTGENHYLQTEYFRMSRRINEIKYGGEYRFHGRTSGLVKLQFNHLYAKYSNVSFTSGLLPTVGVRLNIQEYFVYDFLNAQSISVYANAGKSVNEIPLVHDGLAVRSTILNSSSFRNITDYSGILPSDDIKQETNKQFAFGISILSIANKIGLDYNYFYNIIDNYIAPINTYNPYYPGALNGEPVFHLKNVAQVANYGNNITISYAEIYNWHHSFHIDLIWSKVNNKVRKLYFEENKKGVLPLAGFNNIFTALKEGEELGVIYGTQWERDNNGELIINENGFPFATKYDVLGNSVPDWTASLRPYYSWKKFSIGLTLEYSKGGKVWNGTQAMLDYLGRSKTTAEQRNIKGYVFDGVTQDGLPNVKQVDFNSPGNLYRNRWVRYGESGVGEAYMEDASFLRLSELTVAYYFRLNSNRIQNFSLSFSCNNLFLLTKYKGVDPTSTLYNEKMGRGLDLFNMPSTRSFALNLKITLR